MLRVLFIEDEPAVIDGIKKALEEQGLAECCVVKELDRAEEALESFSPDVVILDIFRGPVADGDTAGLAACELIWDKHFCPIVVYSARPRDVADRIPQHPLVRSTQKGSGSDEEVLRHIAEFTPHIDALKAVNTDVRQRLRLVLRHVAPFAFAAKVPSDKVKDFLVRSARRRVAAMADEALEADATPLASWEHYVLPPLAVHLLTGDIVRRKDGTADNPSDFAVILTPSCDLAQDADGEARGSKALVARCSDVRTICQEVGADETTKAKKLRERLPVFLSKGFGTLCVPLPALPNIFPSMAVVLRNLELIELERIGDGDECDYIRVASVDSPFREMIAWAYMQVAGRPGLPERDFGAWTEEILQALSQQCKEGKK